MEIFTYKDHLNYKRFLEEKANQKAENELHEDNEIYNISNKAVNNEHDKIFRRILDDKKEVAKFINKTLKLRVPILEEQLEKYNSSFVTIELKNQESDIIYKLKGQDIFFLIEHQTKADYAMPLRILDYENEIIKSAIDKNRLGKKDYKFPKVISIVLYTGKTKWNVKKYIQEAQEELKGYKGLEFAKYNIVDVNDYTKEESFLSKAMLIEKARYINTLAIDLEKIVQEMNSKKNVYSEEQKDLLRVMINLVLSSKLKREETEELIKSLKGGEKPMLAVLDMIEKENKRIFRDGKKEGERRGRKMAKIETAKKMLEKGIDIETIIEITGVSKKKIIS